MINDARYGSRLSVEVCQWLQIFFQYLFHSFERLRMRLRAEASYDPSVTQVSVQMTQNTLLSFARLLAGEITVRIDDAKHTHAPNTKI